MQRIAGFRGEWWFLSNFSPSEVLLDDGERYPTVEHAIQAAKTVDPDERARVRTAATPAAAKHAGRRVKFRDGWDGERLDVMLRLLRQKFAVPSLRASLLATGDAELVEENTWNDRFWGVCRGAGQNHLGRLLMQVRDEVRGRSRHTMSAI